MKHNYFAAIGLFIPMACNASLINPEPIDHYIQSTMPQNHIGILVEEVDTGRVVYDYNAHQLFYPASVTKLFSSAVALKTLGPDYRYQTQMLGERQGQTVVGDLRVQFSGDPSLTTEDLYNLVGMLSDSGIQRIQGNVILDTRAYGEPDVSPSWMLEDIPWYFAAPAGAAIINGNSLKVTLTPGERLGDEATVVVDTPAHGVPIVVSGHVKTVTQDASMTDCQLFVKPQSPRAIQLSGCWPIGPFPSTLRLAITEPVAYIQEALATHFQAHGIQIEGVIQPGESDASTLLAEVTSPPLMLLLTQVLQASDNLYADSLLKTLGAHATGTPGTFQNGAETLKHSLHEMLGLPEDSFRLLDGSGSSRYNLVHPSDITRLLYVIYHDPTLRPLFQGLLPKSAKEGNLRSRMQSFDMAGRFMGKTGTATGVSGLAGYFEADDGHLYSIVILSNNALDSRNTLKQWEEALMTHLKPMLHPSYEND